MLAFQITEIDFLFVNQPPYVDNIDQYKRNNQ